MTDTTSAAIRAELNDLTRDLNKTREYLELGALIKGAPAELDKLTKRANDLTAQLADAVTVEAKAERDAYFVGLDDLQITEVSNGDLRNTRFEISWTYPKWDSYWSESFQERETKIGFGKVERRVLEWIVERHPEKIPASILALADTPADALDRYFVFHKRGF
ncbi:hypothetical protein LWE61_08215 [Sphingobium sufflavum]|uniref:hypothetical protein n=1 Tax=Sphingobium sufflavum TaxID=1129547 RepID=UPI001F41346B|nr:hypothetical protein [Sphingobium sufflavum]MCE7796546.1 hypothetical protein [Sphingobium sufflavum]